MKRPHGFDRPAESAPPPAAPEPAAAASSTPEPSATGHADVARTITGPAPVVTEPRSRSARPEAQRRKPFRPGGSPHGRLPSSRDVTKALRTARRERKRLERGEVRRFTKRMRRRRQVWLAAGGVLTALVLGVTLVAFSPLLALKHIDVVGASRLDPAAIEAKLADQLGTPLPMLDRAGISHDLAAFPLIRSYTLESHPPDTLVIRVVERQPIGAVQEGAVFTLVDAAKVPISSTAARPEGVPLIVASGDAAEKDAGSAFAAVASVLSALPADTLAQVDAITATTKDDVSFTLRENGVTVVWGSAENSELKAADLAALLVGAAGANHYDVSSPRSVTTG